jgi:hypothetical protein
LWIVPQHPYKKKKEEIAAEFGIPPNMLTNCTADICNDTKGAKETY